MSYKFVKVTTFYRDYLKQYYLKNSFVKEQSYAEQYSHLMSQAYSWADFYSTHLRSLGVDAQEIVSNAEHLQKAWAREHGLNVLGKDIVIEQLREIRPDVVFFQDSFVFSGEWITRLRELVPSIKLVLGWCCSNYTSAHIEQFRAFDFFLVCSPGFAEDFSKNGLTAYQIHHAFEDSLLPRLQANNPFPFVDFIFLGSIVPGVRGHGVRRDILNALIASGITLDIYAHILTIEPVDLFFRRSAYIVAKMMSTIGLQGVAKSLPVVQKAYYLEEMPSNPVHVDAIKAIAKPSVYGLEMFKALSHGKIAFNYHGEGSGEYACNIRLFEATGAGSCLITDWKKNLHELFELDTEVVTFRSASECIEKVRWLLDHPKETAEIARRGQQRTLRDHNYKIRAEKLHKIILNNLR